MMFLEVRSSLSEWASSTIPEERVKGRSISLACRGMRCTSEKLRVPEPSDGRREIAEA